MSLATTITINLKADYKATRDLSTSQDPLNIDRSIVLSDGTGANQADVIFHDERSLADAGSETLDLYASGSLLDPLGNALTMSKLKFLYIKNTSSDASLLIGGGGATSVGLFSDVTDIMVLPPGGIFMWSAPDATGLDISTNKDLKLEHNGDGSSALAYEIVAIGVD